MTNFKELPHIYKDEDEKKVMDKMQKGFATSQKKLIQRMNQQSEAIVSFDLFKKELSRFMSRTKSIHSESSEMAPPPKFTDNELDCAFVFLCRGMVGPFDAKKVN
mmetsp:Transcript_20852/g.32182  ORF Transcript_20852/g.32182 Transcript_20852/m.32182 type:complete len:105 (-) Transcript_20852:1049-1363(-)